MTTSDFAFWSGVGEGVGSEVVKQVFDHTVSPMLRRVFKKELPAAAAKAKENSLSFLLELAKRIDSIEASQRDVDFVLGKFGDPDVAMTMQSAALAAARTSAAERHRALADLVCSRLRADSDSQQAVVASQAVVLVPQLSAEHLHFLGVFAVARVISPAWRVPPAGEPREIYTKGLAAYRSWLKATLDALLTPSEEPTPLIIHLLSVGAVVVGDRGGGYDPFLRPAPLDRFTQDFDMQPAAKERSEDREFEESVPTISWFKKHWGGDLLAHVALTPVGLLLGVATVDATCDSRHLGEWEWGELTAHLGYLPPEASSLKPGSSEFDNAVLQTLRDNEYYTRAARGLPTIIR